MTMDLRGCSSQRKDPCNSRTLAGARVAYKAITTPMEPVNEGSFRALKVLIQEGNFMMAKYPAPMAGWSRPLPSVVDTIVRALAPAMPDKIPAGNIGVMGAAAVVFFGTDPRSGKGFVTQSTEGAGWGGRPWEDGESSSVSICQGDVRNAPIEKIELKWPVLYVHRALREDSGGPGKFRGGLGVAARVRNLVDGHWNLRTKTGRLTVPPLGLWGGKSGAPSAGLLRLPDEKEFKTVDVTRHWVPANTEAMIVTAGGGGWGDPLERDPEKVRWDVVEGFISVETARKEYGVALNAKTFEIDWKETSILRDKLRQP
jgi:N-methylhydantoinase B